MRQAHPHGHFGYSKHGQGNGAVVRMNDNRDGRGEEEEELPAISAGPMPAVGQGRVPTPRVSTTRIGMQLPE